MCFSILAERKDGKRVNTAHAAPIFSLVLKTLTRLWHAHCLFLLPDTPQINSADNSSFMCAVSLTLPSVPAVWQGDQQSHYERKCTPNRGNVFRTSVTLPGRSDVHQTAVGPSWQELCGVRECADIEVKRIFPYLLSVARSQWVDE
jgi:hypothetical protein